MTRALAIFCVLFLMVLTISSFGSSNPMIRACTLTNAEVQILKLRKSASDFEDEFVFCKYTAVSKLDGLSMHLSLQGQHTEAVSAYFLSSESNINACLDNSGEIVLASTLDGNSIQICRFDDNSMIGNSTLSIGNNDPKNQKLNKALGF